MTARKLAGPPGRGRSWRWLVAYFDQRWFRDAILSAQQAYDACRPDIIVGSSMGGAVAINLATGDTPQVLIAPAWRAWYFLRFGKVRRVKPATVLVHGDRDRTIFPQASRRLLANSPPEARDAGVVASLERRLADQLADDAFSTQGRLVLVRGEDHRCNGDAALRALLGAVEVLSRRASCGVLRPDPTGCG